MIKFYQDKQNKWRAKITAKNGECIHSSHQGYSSKQRCQDNLIDIAIVVIDEIGGELYVPDDDGKIG